MKPPRRSIFGLILLLVLSFHLAPTPVSGKPATSASPKQQKNATLKAEFKKKQQWVLDTLKGGTVVQFYSLHPLHFGPTLEKKPGTLLLDEQHILGQTKVTPQESAKLLEAVRKGVQTDDMRTAECFAPRHGLRVQTPEGVCDLVICFECSQFIISDPKQPQLQTWRVIHGGRNVFRAIVKRYHLDADDPNP